MALAPGSKAPDLDLRRLGPSGLEDVSLSSLWAHGPLTLLFVPAAFTRVCTEQLCDRSGGLAALSALGSQVYAITPDTPWAQAAWAARDGIDVPFLSDFGRLAIDAYDVALEDFAGLGKGCLRSAFVISSGGVVVHSEAVVPSQLPSSEAIREALSQLASSAAD